MTFSTSYRLPDARAAPGPEPELVDPVKLTMPIGPPLVTVPPTYRALSSTSATSSASGVRNAYSTPMTAWRTTPLLTR